MTNQKIRQITEKDLVDATAHKKRTAPYPAPTAPGLTNHTVHFNNGIGTFELHIDYKPMHENFGLTVILQMQRADGSNGNKWYLDHTITAQEASAHKVVMAISNSIFNPANYATVSITYRPTQVDESLPLKLTLAE